MHGVILAVGGGPRFYQLSMVVFKQLLPASDKAIINYLVWVLMLAGLRGTSIISTPKGLPNIRNLLGAGSIFGQVGSPQVFRYLDFRNLKEAKLVNEKRKVRAILEDV